MNSQHCGKTISIGYINWHRRLGLGLSTGLGQLQQGVDQRRFFIRYLSVGQLAAQDRLNPEKPHLMASGATILLAQLLAGLGPAASEFGVDLAARPQGMRHPYLFAAGYHLGIDFLSALDKGGQVRPTGLELSPEMVHISPIPVSHTGST